MTSPHELRAALLAGIPVGERHIEAAGVPTAVLEGGDGPPLVLLHGPGESAVNWRWVLPELTRTHRVIAPDLPAHGSSGTPGGAITVDTVLDWLPAVGAATCVAPPVVVGHVLGGAVAARHAARRPGGVGSVVLVGSLGLGRFRPRPGFLAEFVRFAARPGERSFTRFMGQCAHDVEQLRTRMADDWPTFVAYNVALARSEQARAAGRLFRIAGVPRIPAEEMDRIRCPVGLVWGRHDRATRLAVAERASARHGWPLEIVEDAADDPARDQPAAFVGALRRIVAAGSARR